jgi:hypothetical protein
MKNMEDSKDLTPEASLKVIYNMIEMTKSNIGKNYFYYLFWGYLIAVTCLTEYILMTVVQYQKHYLVWPFLMSLGAIVTLFFQFRQNKHRTSKTFIGTTMGFFWLGWLVSFCILLGFLISWNKYELILPVSMAMYGLGMFVSGGIISFRLLMMGAIMAWISSIIAFYNDYPVQLLIMVGLMIVSYIIPGYMLKLRSKEQGHV